MAQMVITIDTDEGEVEVRNVGGKYEEGYLKKDPPKVGDVSKFGTLLFAHSSPGCVYYFYGGRWWKVCS